MNIILLSCCWSDYASCIQNCIDLWGVVINAVIMVTGIIAILVTIVHGNRHREQSFFEKYTARYQHIIEIMPESVLEGEPLPQKDREKAIRAIRLYIDLCSEEYYLYEQKYIDEKVWEEWKGGMKIMFTYPSVKTVFEEKYQKTYIEFAEFIELKLYSEEK